jgi:pimeloyl-ACP methyl ester carboxylesterase
MTTYNYATVRGRKMFYREAGNKDAAPIALLHGFPSSYYPREFGCDDRKRVSRGTITTFISTR